MKKQFFILFCLLLTCLSGKAQTKVATEVIDGLKYDLYDNNTASLIQNESQYWGNINIPATVSYNGSTYNVTSIDTRGFYYCTDLTSVTIPNSVTSIGEEAFLMCSSLTSVNIPNSVTSIAKGAFSRCMSLTSIYIPNSVTTIGRSAFSYCSKLSFINIPNSVTSIDQLAFSSCTKLTSINIPSNVTSIGNSTFYGCTGLTSVTIPNSVTSIGDRAFMNCTGLTSVTIPSGVTSIGGSAFENCTGLSKVSIDDIAAWCAIDFGNSSDYGNSSANPLAYAKHLFIGNTEVKDLVIPSGIEAVKNYAFYNCEGLTSVTIPNSVTSIGKSAFIGCTGLTSITIPNSVTSIGQSAFFGCTGLTSITIPNSVTSIERSAFEGCTGLTSINIPNSVTSIGAYAFNNCTGLTSINIPEGVTSIEWSAFGGCTGLTSITIPEGVTSISVRAFYFCHGLTSVTIPSSVTSIEAQAFEGCTNLKEVNCYSVALASQDIASDAFSSSILGNVTLYVPESVISEYQSRTPWNNFGSIKPLEHMELTDGQSYTRQIDLDLQTLTYTRTFNNTEWQALYLPFSMNYADWSEDFDIARINDIHQADRDEDGVIDETDMEIIHIKSGSTEPHTPYLIRAKSTGTKTITVNDTRIYAASQMRYDVSSWYLLFTFVGTYTPISGTDMVNGGYLALGGGELHPSDGSGSLSSYRWYLEVTDRDGKTHNVKSIRIVDKDETTGMTELETQPQQQPVYDLSGRQVTTPKKGMYIINGKKVLVK